MLSNSRTSTRKTKEDFIAIPPYIWLRSMGTKSLRMTILATNSPGSGLPATGGFWLAFKGPSTVLVNELISGSKRNSKPLSHQPPNASAWSA
jgi:hypothetical protein